ncbi:MAG: capsular biosynthesis protein [Spirochaetes bacterium GWD1_61_31]|nr:MAG: capsular biosynthesis protein [Spirochaetes bacterium GWB1_60_80]OHD28678.1 MAG: capsular biosynthesis protein [Spirochaetes bacterium GWC1_61_12]OHD38900.1 MAG: capsular biosynthesis protein [Spirochaetes bacterium GWD1_61_31]OHD43321.1 MAG: capsular biosynthesis protein [Spirochaetes bacterium GWE1_60_18]OHD58859.1 MAG: capsular biosynthesis protein [Spirochaetes bacterium GWF1_60_12]HAP42513.1 polysaccharide biosynthesis protein [Spirochaetaceae bacterium]
MKARKGKNVYIIGAGLAGLGIASELAEKPTLGKVQALLDDDPAKIGGSFAGIPIIGPVAAALKGLTVQPQDRVIIAVPSASQAVLQTLHQLVKATGFASVHIVPAVAQIIEGDVHLAQTRSIDPLDILGRPPAAIGLKDSMDWLRGKRVLISGAGGSIGSELARQMLEADVERLYLLGHGENSIYQIDRELRRLQADGVGSLCAIVPLIGDLKDRAWLHFVMPRLRVDAVFHAAAYKHVPLMEANPVAVVENNVFGTRNLLDASLASRVSRFILISTDKAVQPLCSYGASKYLSERLVLASQSRAKAQDPDSRYCFVRFGNVLGSRGSILPLFSQQIEAGGPLTVTHPDTSRFFMTIPEACSLVLKAGSLADQAPAFLLDMGQPVLIRELAEQLIRFYGLEPHKDIAIQYIGLRPGERLHESLSSPDESLSAGSDRRIQLLHCPPAGFSLDEVLVQLTPVCFHQPDRPEAYRNRRLLRQILRRYIPSLEENHDESEY